MAERDKPHLIIPTPARAVAYRPPPQGGGSLRVSAPDDRRRHGQQLQGELRQAEQDAATRRRQQAPVAVDGAIDGFYASFDSFPGLQLALASLDPRQGRRHPELMSVQEIDTGSGLVERATVFIPEGTITYFLNRITTYLDTVDQATVRHRVLVDPIQSIRLATIEALWTDPPHEFSATGETVWWEVWLRRRDGHELDRLRAFASAVGAQVGRQSLGFGDRTVVLVQATAEQLATAVDVLDDLAELRRPHEPAVVLARAAPAEQREWIDDLVGRLEPADQDAPAVCVIDSGIFRDHPLLHASLDVSDCHAADPSWPVHDDWGHGTEVAGLALYSDLAAAMGTSGPVRPRHRLESVKVLPPPPGHNPRELYPVVTIDGVARAEIQAPHRRRVHALAITAPELTPTNGATPEPMIGQPSSWSATLDALAVGRSVDASGDDLAFLDTPDAARPRLFVVCAGNIRNLPDWDDDDHLGRSDIQPVEDPAQAWNALTVGAFTERDAMTDAPPGFDGWTPLAARGELSPFSRTSMTFSKTWPIKPDVVLEGGNVARSPDGTDFQTPDNLQLLTTNAPVGSGPRIGTSQLLTTTNATSAATGQASALVASVWAAYPALWPETVRALIVHSAEWTPAMARRFASETGRRARARLLRRYGMGVPDLTRATRSATDALTLLAQDIIHPFEQGTMREIHFHDLPWPTDVLADLGDAPVQLRVTLSYFIEPNPGRRGWQRRYNYASHGLRFDIRRATESNREFEQRLNQNALAEEERRPTPATDRGWFFGSEHQSAAGSLHTDLWHGTAIDLAHRGALAVYPVTGWWKENPTRDHSNHGARYALTLSITTPEHDADIWTPVAQQIGIPTTIET